MILIVRRFLISVFTIALSSVVFAQDAPTSKTGGANESTSPVPEAAKSTHSFVLSNSEAKIFDTVILGRTSLDQLSVKSRNTYGEIGNVFFSMKEGSSIPLLFGTISLNTDTFDAVFYENILIELRLSSDSVEGIDAQLAKELRSSFDKKYKKLTRATRREKDEDYSFTFTTERWSGPQDAFVVELQDKRKFTVNLSSCKAKNNLLRQLGIATSSLDYQCNKATDNLPIIGLAYKFIPGVEAATRAIKRDEEADALKKKADYIKKSSKF